MPLTKESREVLPGFAGKENGLGGGMRRVFAVVLLAWGFQAHADDWQESEEIARLFEDAGVEGTFVLYDVEAERLVGHDRTRAERRYVPASTFKVVNTLIGLSAGAVKDVDEVLPYGGEPQPFETWERDMSLREAIAISNVPIYQELARRTGLGPMRRHVAAIGYGNAELGTVVDTFWLRGPLEVNAVEQARVLAALAGGTLAYPEDIQAQVREILELERQGDSILYGKTGWGNAQNQGIGWWVGWVSKDRRIYAFALNMDMGDVSDAGRRVELGRAALAALGIL